MQEATKEDYSRDSRYLAIKEANQATELITVTLLSLKDKRVTLEEKMIKSHLHELAELLSSISVQMHKRFRVESYDIDKDTISNLRVLTGEILANVASLKKITDYNLNFLEQYFEHDYYATLVQEYRFKERLLETISSLNHTKDN